MEVGKLAAALAASRKRAEEKKEEEKRIRLESFRAFSPLKLGEVIQEFEAAKTEEMRPEWYQLKLNILELKVGEEFRFNTQKETLAALGIALEMIFEGDDKRKDFEYKITRRNNAVHSILLRRVRG